MSTIPKGDPIEFAYRLIEKPAGKVVVSTKDRNRLVEYFTERLPFYSGSIFELVSVNLKGGMWEVSARKSSFG